MNQLETDNQFKQAAIYYQRRATKFFELLEKINKDPKDSQALEEIKMICLDYEIMDHPFYGKLVIPLKVEE